MFKAKLALQKAKTKEAQTAIVNQLVKQLRNMGVEVVLDADEMKKIIAVR